MKNSHGVKNYGKILAFLLIICSIQIQVNAQCGCDHTVPLSVEIFDASSQGVSPGDVICVEAGTRDRLHFQNLAGTEASPVIIKNCGGQVVINGTGGGSSNVPLKLSGNKFFRLTGTGDPGYEYGFKIGGEAHASVEAAGQATNFEMDHIEIISSGFAGFMLKTDPNGTGENVRPNAPDAVNGGFTMYDISVHDCYIHDILPDGEGIYMGNSFWSSGHPPTGGQLPHSIYGAKIYNNLIERTGREAIQAGAVVEGLEIYNNRIYDYGYQNTNGSQNNGIQIGEGSSGKIYNNFLKNGPDGGSRAIYLLGLGDNYVYNNVVVGADNVALNANLRPSPLEDDPGNQGFLGGAYFINNTVIDTKGAEAFGTYLNDAPDNVLYNNLVVTSNNEWDGISGSNWTKANNIRYVVVDDAGFTDSNNDDYSLALGSAAIDAGTDVSSYNVDIDFLGASRPANGTYDCGAYEYTGQVSSNNDPVLSAIGDQTVAENAMVNVNVSATDQDNDDITFSAANLPAFASFTDHGDNTATLTISPQEGDAGTYTGLMITADDGNGGGDSETFSVLIENDDSGNGGAGTPIYRVNAGGSLQSDSELDWERDKQTDPSPYFDSQNCVNYTTGSDTWSGTNNTSAPDNIFGPYRYDNNASWGERQHWDFPVDNGDYEVRLYFKAISTSSGTDVFDVAIEGTVELDEYDIYAVAGGSNIPVEEVFFVSVSDGNLDIDLPSITSGKSLIHGIEVLSVTNTPPVLNAIGDQLADEDGTENVSISASDQDSDNLTFSASNLPSFASFTDHGDDTATLTVSPQQGDAGTYTGVQITVADGNGGVDSETFTITVNDTGSGEGSVLFRVNAGGSLQSDSELDWERDKQTDPSLYFDSQNCVNYTTGSDTWSGTNNTSAPDNIFGPYRYDNNASWGERQHWDFPVNNGDYEVRLYFKAISTSSGTNVFDVAIEGNVELDEYDVYAAAGGSNIPVEEVFFVSVSDGNLDIDLPSITSGKSIIHGIEILGSGSSARLTHEMNEAIQEENTRVYPNPMGDYIHIDLGAWIELPAVEVYLLDNAGKLLNTGLFTDFERSKTVDMDVSGLDLTPGIYYLKIKGGSYQEVRKMIRN